MGLDIAVVPPQLWENAALIGGARLMDDDFWEKVSEQLPEL